MTDAGEIRITRADAEGLASKLEAMMKELSDHERIVLGLILARAAVSEPDVEGFAYEAYVAVKGQKQGAVKSVKQGVINGGVTQAAGFGQGVDVITVKLGFPTGGPQTI